MENVIHDVNELHRKILYPVCRIRAKGGGGSGVLVYSGADPHSPGKHINIVLTCEHVISDNISLREEFDPVLKRDVKKDLYEEVNVEMFDYSDSEVISANSTRGDIIAYDKGHDLAAIKLQNFRKFDYVASILPKSEVNSLRIFDPVWVSGCSLSHDPFPSPGNLTYLREIIDQKAYLMSNAPSIFGNSGGALFGGNGFLLGLTSRVRTLQLGFSVDVVTWMQFSTHPERLYEFFANNELQFLTDPNDEYYKAMERRDKRRRNAMKDMFWESGKRPVVGHDEEEDQIL